MIIKEIDVKGIMTKSNLPVADFSVNPYVGCAHACKYCYASFMKRFTNYSEPWGDFVDVKNWGILKNPSKYAGKEAFIGSVTDPYQPCEKKYERTRKLLKQLQGSGISISIATRSDLVLRDLDLIKTFPNARVAISINTIDENFKKEMDKGATIKRRLETMKQLYESGIKTTCFISPIFPGITDPEAIIEKAKDRCNLVWLENLNLRGDYRARIMDWIHNNHPELDELYYEIYSKKNRDYWNNLNEKLQKYAENNNMKYVRDDDTQMSEFGQLPIMVNYFYHEEVKKSAKKNKK
ncbi:radical SAM mobile pair protein B [Lachnospiraceae bacterium C7]|nr:radical SAM mobile pair protein B [Lachnospiraceae bacterium C7]